jgi:anaerobic ribonucleoside-triphosphate reductase activating protein
MLKYENTLITFTEVPDEISLCINLTCCPCRCKECFEPWLRKDYGSVLSFDVIQQLRLKSPHISCICFMGGDNDHLSLYNLCQLIKSYYPHLKLAFYSGLDYMDPQLQEVLDYYKFGSYMPEHGPLNQTTTNQRFMKKTGPCWEDITYKFQIEKR